jgi:chromosome segregation ATPase
MANRTLQDRNVNFEEESAEITAGEKDRESPNKQQDPSPYQKGHQRELNVAEWSSVKKPVTEQVDTHFYLTNVMAVMAEMKTEMNTFKEEMKTELKTFREEITEMKTELKTCKEEMTEMKTEKKNLKKKLKK